MQIPSVRPMKKPPIWEKLSSPGRRPRMKEMTTSSMMKARSFQGLVRSFQVYRRSRSVNARIPNRAPEAPVEVMPVAAKLPPSTKPKMPEEK